MRVAEASLVARFPQVRLVLLSESPPPPGGYPALDHAGLSDVLPRSGILAGGALVGPSWDWKPVY